MCRWLAVCALLGGCSEQGITVHGNAPEPQITSHDDGDEVSPGTPTPMRGSVHDKDDLYENLVATWVLGTETVCEDTPDDNGITVCDVVFLPSGDDKVTLEVKDDSGASGSDNVTLVLGEGVEPVAHIITPKENGDYSEDRIVTFEGNVSHPDLAGDELVAWWESSIDGELRVDSDPDGQGNVLGFGNLSEGQHAITLFAEDPWGGSGTDTVIIDVEEPNVAPTAPTIRINPSDPISREDFGVIIDVPSTDANGHVVTYSYTWYRNGNPTSETGDTISATATLKDEVWRVVVVPNDGYEDGPPAEDTVTVLNSPPGAPAVSISPQFPQEDDDLVCIASAVDPDGDAMTYTFTWKLNGSAWTGTVQDSGGHTGNMISRSDTALDDVWTCEAIANDGTEDGTVGTSNTTITWRPDYNGTFAISAAPVHSCASGSVNFNIGTLTFSESAGVLNISGAPKVMKQDPAPGDENFSASGVISGACDETYTVAGSFTGPDTFSGTFVAQFNGWGCGNCLPNPPAWQITGTRQ